MIGGLIGVALNYYQQKEAKKMQEELMKQQEEMQRKAEQLEAEKQKKIKDEQNFQREVEKSKMNLDKAIEKSDETAGVGSVPDMSDAKKRLSKTNSYYRNVKFKGV